MLLIIKSGYLHKILLLINCLINEIKKYSNFLMIIRNKRLFIKLQLCKFRKIYEVIIFNIF